ncbi:sulfotransferase family protein [Algiphilus sp.]|uniref:sulfotransferase family protein n=1 Tax=Algiphilus sp. TaxID=1872431 RepID=UPI003C7DEBA3
MKGLEPHFAIIGAQKTGSTYVHGLLQSHPEIYLPTEEVRFFEDPEYGEGHLETLRELFVGRSERLLGIKRPDYLARPEVPQRLRRHLPNIKLVAILRNPIERLVSAYYYYVKLGFLPPLHINEGLRRILDGDDLGSIRTPELIDYGRYGQHLERYLAVFPRDQLLILMQEDVNRAPLEVGNRLAWFLGVAPFESLPTVRRDNSGVYSITRLRWLRQRNRFLYTYDESSKLTKKGGSLNFARAAAITAFDRYLLFRVMGNSKPILDCSLRSRLNDIYRPELAQIETLLDRRLTGWLED